MKSSYSEILFSKASLIENKRYLFKKKTIKH